MKRRITFTLLTIGLVILFLTNCHVSIAAPGGLDRVLAPDPAAQPISSVLNSDGSIKRGVSRNFDPKGFRMTSGGKGAPRFVANSDLSPVDRLEDMSPSAVGVTGGAVFAIAVSGSDVYVGGAFTTAGEISVNYIAKWDGSNWSQLGSGMNGFVTALAVSGNGDLYAGGSFTTAGGVLANRIAKWNGSSWSSVGSGTNGQVWDLKVSGTDVYAGGDFTSAGGASANRIARWNGASWSAFGSGMNDRVSAIALSGSGEVYAGGRFTTAGGFFASAIAKWNGSSWAAVGLGMSGTLNGVSPAVHSLAVSGNGELYAGGWFMMAGGVSVNNIAKWNGSSWSPLSTGTGGPVSALAISGSGNLYVGGDFNTAGGNWVDNIAEWNGSYWSGLGSGISSPESEWILAMAISGNGNLYAGGNFTTAGGYPANHIAMWNGAGWSALVHIEIPSQAENITFASVQPYQMNVSWTKGNGNGRVVKINTVNSFTAPADGTNPSWDSRYGGSGEQVVYNGNDSSFTVTGLSPNTTYYFRVYEYNSYQSFTVFNTSSATNNPNSQTTIPCTAAITVMNTNDSGLGSLRQATTEICSGGTIDFDPSIFATPQTIPLTSGTLYIDKNLTIRGPGASLLSISGNNASRVFYIPGDEPDSEATLDGMTIRNGNSGYDYYAGGIFNAGTLTIINSTVSGNGAVWGGGIYNAFSGRLTIINSTVSGNTATFVPDPELGNGGEGAGIYNQGTLAVTNSTISANSADYEGGGILSYGIMTVSNSTVSGNSAYSGGGIYNYGTLNVSNSTISNNGADFWGGGIVIFSSSTESLRNTIVAGNFCNNFADIAGTIDTASHNLIGDAASSGGITNGVNGNIVGVNPLLGPLRNNGGPTMTHALRTGSPAINVGDNCVLVVDGCGYSHPALTTDQRGLPRNGAVDIGAFERQTNDPSGTTPFDFDGDGKADQSVYRDGDWYVYGSRDGFMAAGWGNSTDKIVPADYDGDGRTDHAIYRGGEWWILKSDGTGYAAVNWGNATDIPVPADYDGDGKADFAVYREGMWWIYQTTSGPTGIQWGNATDIPVPADYDGDGKADMAIIRDGTWWIYQTTSGPTGIQWGNATDTPVPADYDGDGKADVAIVRDGTWWIYQSTLGATGINWGYATDIPVPADYDGDGKAEQLGHS